MLHELVTDTPQEELAKSAQTPAPGHDQVSMQLAADRDQRRRSAPRTNLEHRPVSNTGVLQRSGPFAFKLPPRIVQSAILGAVGAVQSDKNPLRNRR